MPEPAAMKTCFVIQGYGKKTDYANGRVLDLDASYAVIKEAVVAAGLKCIRCDEVVHSGLIDAPMYELLMRADLVIADLSTSNINAAFELGIRYGLRPYATIIVAEEGFTQPFDVSHSVIRRYKHLGEDIGLREATRFKADLSAAIAEIVAGEKPDSPVYTFMSHLVPPNEGRPDTGVSGDAAKTRDAAVASRGYHAAANDTAKTHDMAAASLMLTGSAPRGMPPPPAADTAKLLRETAFAKINPPPGGKADFAGARELLKLVLAQHAADAADPNDLPDPFVVQQLALATYKAAQPTLLQALLDAHAVLQRLNPATTNDPETLGLWGAVHKRMWELQRDPTALSESIAAYSRGFYLKQDHYNGVNLALLLETRALEHARAGDRDEAVADRVLARRTREDVLRYATPQVAALAELAVDKRYWLTASLWETAAGLGRAGDAARWEKEARNMKPAQWMLDSTAEQVTKLRAQQAALAEALAAPPAGGGASDGMPGAPVAATSPAGTGAAS